MNNLRFSKSLSHVLFGLILTLSVSQVNGQRLKRAEYFIDADRGVGAGTPIAFTSTDTAQINFQLPVSTLADGFHSLIVRVKNDSGWSPALSRFFYKQSEVAASPSKYLRAVEYYLDTDPGAGRGTRVTQITRNQDTIVVAFDLQINSLGLSEGFHRMQIRVQDSLGVWAPGTSRYFYMSGSSNPITGSKLVSAEYYIDNDPGTGLGTRIPNLSGLRDSISLAFEIPISTLQLREGFHRLQVRVKDSLGIWTTGLSRYFLISGNDLTLSRPGLKSGEIFFDVDPGRGRGIPMLNLVKSDSVEIVKFVSVLGLRPGAHTASVRFQDSSGTWTHSIKRSFTVAQPLFSNIHPRGGGNIGQMSFTLNGRGFTDSSSVTFIPTRAGLPTIIVPDSLLWTKDGVLLGGVIDLEGKDTGVYHVDVRLGGRGDTTLRLIRGFTIEKGIVPEVRAEIVGPDVIRLNSWTPYTIVLANNGNIDASAVPLYITIPHGADVKFGFQIQPSELQNEFSDSVETRDEEQRLKPIFTPIDSALGIPTLKGDFYNLSIPFIGARATLTLQVLIKSPTINPDFAIAAYTDLPSYGPSRTNTDFDRPVTVGGTRGARIAEVGCITNNNPKTCAEANFNFALQTADLLISSIPGLGGCAYGLISSVICKGVDIVKNAGKSGQISPILDFGYTIGTSLMECVTPGQRLGKYRKILDVAIKINKVLNAGSYVGTVYSDDEKCRPPRQPKPKMIRIVGSFDPNEKLGVKGYGRNSYLNSNERLSYLIRFENLRSATAPAHTVLISDTLDTSVLDPKTIELGYVYFGDTIVTPASGQNSLLMEVGLSPRLPYTVRITSKYDSTSRILSWFFETLNSTTLEPITDPLGGFLPPNLTAPQGEGGVFFTIKTKSTTNTNVKIRNRASIIFDQNTPIITNRWENTADKSRPRSAVNALPSLSPSSFGVSWQGQDSGSGIRDYTVYVSKNNGPFRLWLNHTSALGSIYTGGLDTTYRFMSIATDSAYNEEWGSAIADASTLVAGKSKQEILAKVNLALYPNPSFGSFNLSLKSKPQNVLFSVYTSSGALVLTQSLSLKEGLTNFYLDLSKHQPGIYTFKVATKDGVVVQRGVIL